MRAILRIRRASCRFDAILRACLLLVPFAFAAPGRLAAFQDGFESGASAWNGGSLDGTRGHNSNTSLRIVDDDPANCESDSTVAILPVARGRTHFFEGWIRGDQDEQEVLVALQQYRKDGSWIPFNNMDFVVRLGSRTDWTFFLRLIDEFHPEATGVRIYLYPALWSEGGERIGTAWFDDVRFEPVRGAWDFETGREDWSGGEFVGDDPHGGTSCLRVIDADASRTVTSETVVPIPVSHDRARVLEVWIRGELPDQEAMVIVSQYDGSGQWIPYHNLDFIVATGTGWTRFRQIVRGLQPETKAVRIHLTPVPWTEAGERTGTAWFDDLCFEETHIPPATQGSWIFKGSRWRIWRSPVEQKVVPQDVLDDGAPFERPVEIAAARGEREPFQVVVLPLADDALVGVVLSPLAGPWGATIPPSAVTVRQVVYLEVVEPTDSRSYHGRVPDPLPLAEPSDAHPLEFAAGVQQPLWFTLSVPAGIPAGQYDGTVELRFRSGGRATIPLRARIWGFDLPAEHGLRTAFGLSCDAIDRYHGLGGDRGLRREVFRLYLEDFAAHRISPIDPFGDDGFVVRFPNLNWLDGEIVPDPTGATNRVLEVVDERADLAVCTISEPVGIEPGRSYTVSWRARTDLPRKYLVALWPYDAADAWIPGWNIDFIEDGDSAWRQASKVLPPSSFDDRTTAARIVLFAVSWTLGFDKKGTTWFDDISLRREGAGPNLVANGDFEYVIRPESIDIETDFSAFDAAARRAFGTLAFDSFQLRLPGFAAAKAADGGPFRGSFAGYEWGTPEYEATFARILNVLTDHLEANGWLDRAYAYWCDEPSPAIYDLVIEGMDLLHRADPRLRRLLTIDHGSPSELAGRVDTWVPQLHLWGADWTRERRQAGDEMWWYVCTSPKGLYPNFFIDHPGVEHRLQSWMAWALGVEGSLYWSVNYWTHDALFPPPNMQDPWVDPMSHTTDGAGGRSGFGNGDGRLLYPPRSWQEGGPHVVGPTPSIRWELIREGIEDWEYFRLLADAARRLEEEGKRPDLVDEARGLLEVPHEIFATLTEFTNDPELIQEHRQEVARLLEEITVLFALEFRRGDANADGTVDISDGIFIFDFLFMGNGPPTCRKTADANDDGTLDISDSVYLLSFLFMGESRPADPFMACGLDPTPDGLTCEGFKPCP